jgi:precorrin-6B methylase 2
MNLRLAFPERHVAVLKRKTRVAMLRAREAAGVFRSHGAVAAAKFGVGLVGGILREHFPGARPPKSNAVDRQYGTDTAEKVKLHGLDIRSPNYQYAIYYRPTDFPILLEILSRLALRHEDYTFVDYGSGKGLALLQAAGFPFRKIIGVEFARELHEIARRNLDRYPARLRRSEIELVHGDAVEFIPQAGNLVIYLYEPFEAPVTRQIIARVREFRLSREVVVACVWSKNAAVCSKSLWDAELFLTTMDEGNSWTIYRAT